MLKERFVGLDIGTSNVRVVVADFESGGLAGVCASAVVKSTGVQEGVVVDIESAALAISTAVAKVTSSNVGLPRKVIVNISGKQIASLNSAATVAITRTSRRISPEDLTAAAEQAKVIVLPPDREIVQTVSRCSSVDGQEKVLRPIGLFGSRLVYETHIITSTFSHIHNIMAAVTSAKLGVDSFVLSSVAACEALLYPEEKKLGVLLADIGESVTDIAIYIEGRLTFSAVVPVGGGQITRDIASAFKISESDAESLKTGWGSISIDDNGGDNRLKVDIAEVGTNVRKHVSSIELSEIIEPRLEGLFNSVRNELIKSGTYGLLAAGSVLCGGSSRLCGAAGMCARILRMPARVAVQTLVSINEPGSDSVEFATAAGLTLYAASNPNKPAFGFESGLQNMTNQLKSFLARFSGSD